MGLSYQQRCPKIVVRHGVRRVDPAGVPVTALRLLGVALVEQQAAQIQPGIAVFGPNFDGLPVGLDRFVAISRALVHQPEVVVKLGIGRVDRDRFGHQILGVPGVASLRRKDAQQVQGLGIIRIAMQDLAVKLFGLAESAGLVMAGACRELRVVACRRGLYDGLPRRGVVLGVRWHQKRPSSVGTRRPPGAAGRWWSQVVDFVLWRAGRASAFGKKPPPFAAPAWPGQKYQHPAFTARAAMIETA